MNSRIQEAVLIGKSLSAITVIRAAAKKALPQFPTDGCATYISCLLRSPQVNLGNPVLVSAQKLADYLQYTHGWERISLGKEQAGDIAVTIDLNHNGLADHIFLVLDVINRSNGQLLITDNQESTSHIRYEGGHGKTPVHYYLRAPDDQIQPGVDAFGKELDGDEFIYRDGKMYAALGAMKSHLDVVWDEETKRATVNLKKIV